ncbi:putative F-box domain-containing protein [Seiridium cardinale]
MAESRSYDNRSPGRNEGPPPEQPRPVNVEESPTALNSLPMELQLIIISCLDAASLVTVRQVCRQYRQIITAGYVVKQFTRPDGFLDGTLGSICSTCLTIPPNRCLISENERLGGLWRATCFRCFRLSFRSFTPSSSPFRVKTISSYLSRHGRILPLAKGERTPNNELMASICTWCGWPFCRDRRLLVFPERHQRCEIWNRGVIALWAVLGLVQFSLGFAGGVAAFSVYQDHKAIFIPAAVRFVITQKIDPAFTWVLLNN